MAWKEMESRSLIYAGVTAIHDLRFVYTSPTFDCIAFDYANIHLLTTAFRTFMSIHGVST